MSIWKKKLSLVISSVFLYASGYMGYMYISGIISMNAILDNYHVYYKNRIQNTYVILEKNEKKLLKQIMKYDWNIEGVRELTKDKLIVYLKPSSSCVSLLDLSHDDGSYNLIYIHNVDNRG